MRHYPIRIMDRTPVRTSAACVLALGLVLGALITTSAKTHADTRAVRLDDFDRTYGPGEEYGKWELQKIAPFFGSGEEQFFQFVHKGDDEHYIHLRSGDNNSFSLGVEQDFRLEDWPILAWEWKVTRLPDGGDVRVKARDDQAGAMCVIVDPGLVGFDSLCYIWENSGPKDEPITSTKRDASRYLILRTAKEDGSGKWYSERRNILEDYTRVFGKAPRENAIIGIQIDSDSTESSAEAYYRNIYRRKS